MGSETTSSHEMEYFSQTLFNYSQATTLKPLPMIDKEKTNSKLL